MMKKIVISMGHVNWVIRKSKMKISLEEVLILSIRFIAENVRKDRHLCEVIGERVEFGLES